MDFLNSQVDYKSTATYTYFNRLDIHQNPFLSAYFYSDYIQFSYRFYTDYIHILY